MKIFLAPDHGGDAVSGGGHPADSAEPASEAINDAFDQEAGRGETADVGEPGSRNNPVRPSRDEIARRAQEFWEEEGRPDGRADDHWRRAEGELSRRESNHQPNE